MCNKLQCLLCNYECKHVAYIESYLESENPPEVLEQMISILNAPSTGTKSVSPMGISWKKSAFELPEHIKSILRDGVLQSFQCNAEGDVILLCESDKKLCTSCKSELGYEDEKLPLITEQRIFTAIGKKLQSLEYYIIENNYYDHTSVRRLKCINCGLLHHFDGYESGMLNMGVCVVSYGVLRSYMHHFLNAR